MSWNPSLFVLCGLKTARCLLAACLLVTPAVFAADPLATAKSLSSGRFSGWKYGTSAKDKKVDCVQFVLAVAEEASGMTFKDEIRSQILITSPTGDEIKKDPSLIVKGDRRTKGIQQALVDSGRGKVVEPADAQPGDFVQYWMKKKDGSWFGHAAVLENVTKKGDEIRATLFGAHAKQGKICTSSFALQLNGKDRQVYLVRFNP